MTKDFLKHRYSIFIRPLQVVIDCISILVVLLFTSIDVFVSPFFILYILIFWIFSAFYTGYYRVFRFTKLFRLPTLIVRHFFLFSLGFFAFFGIFKEGVIVNQQFLVLCGVLVLTSVSKLLQFFFLRWYRNKGGNYRKVVILGADETVQKIKSLFLRRKNMGYSFLGFFSDKSHKDKLGELKDSYAFILENSVDEIYCSLKELDKKDLKKITGFANMHGLSLKLIPDFNKIYSKDRNLEYYDDTTIIYNVKKLPFESYENYIIKRLFDIVFSIFACVFVLSWLYPILWLLIKMESKGPVIFKQKREGLHGTEFTCYKFRSMRINSEADSKHTSKGDPRVTRIGAFIRKTSLDEIPQFINVLLGDMSVVGPRPHVEALSKQYKEEVEVENYIKRYAMKPGITGLAQVSGYRGEVTEYFDIKNRVRMDVFYIENWSFLLDVKIILMTIFNVFKGEEKAY